MGDLSIAQTYFYPCIYVVKGGWGVLPWFHNLDAHLCG